MKSKIMDWLRAAREWLSLDGLLHLLVCTVIVLFFGAFLPLWGAIIVAMVAGMVKEIYDLISQKGTPEWRDLVCDLIGIVLGLIIATLWLLIR